MTGRGFVIWNTSFSVENDEMDDEHRKIMSALNRLHCLEREGIDEPVVKSILQDLLHYTEKHCAHEEALMVQWKYDGYETQRTVHQQMIQRTRELALSPSSRNYETLFDHSVTLLNQWWVNHIQAMDHEYISAMQASLD